MKVQCVGVLSYRQRKILWYLCGFLLVLLGEAVGVKLGLAGNGGNWAELCGALFSAEQMGLSQLCFETVVLGIPILFLLCLLGFLAIGQPLILCVLVGYGTCMGSSMLLQCRGESVFFRCVALTCYFAPLCLLFVTAARESLRFSVQLLRCCTGSEGKGEMPKQLRLYCLRYLVLGIALLLLGLLYSLLFCGVKFVG
jgi:hypothetical protein